MVEDSRIAHVSVEWVCCHVTPFAAFALGTKSALGPHIGGRTAELSHFHHFRDHRRHDIRRTHPAIKRFCPSWSCAFLFPSIITVNIISIAFSNYSKTTTQTNKQPLHITQHV